MSPRSKREYLEAIVTRYRRAARKEKAYILDEFCSVCGYHRKHAIRLLRRFKRFAKPKQKKRGRPSLYGKGEILAPLKRIWLAANLPCSRRLKALLPLWLPGYEESFGTLEAEVTESLQSISSATIDRLLQPVRVKYKTHGRSTTKPGTLLRKHIPVKTNQWDESRPGFLEADTVAHCGDSMAGSFAFTIDCVELLQDGLSKGPYGAKGKPTCLSSSKTSRSLFLSRCWVLIVITAGSSSTIIS
jgi:hypothetical protein